MPSFELDSSNKMLSKHEFLLKLMLLCFAGGGGGGGEWERQTNCVSPDCSLYKLP